MTHYLAFSLLLTTVAGATVAGAGPRSPDPAPYWRSAGLVLGGPDAPPDNAATEQSNADRSKSCDGVSFIRNLKYGESGQNVLDVASGDIRDSAPRPVLLLVAGESFDGDNAAADIAGALADQALCFAARRGMVGVSMSYRRAPDNPWPSGARDVAAATSWLHQNVDLFGGSRDEIVAVGYSVGAFHLASLLGHKELQESDSDIAGAVLVSGLYRIGGDASAAEKSYFGADASQYDERSAYPGILRLEIPILLAWAAADPPRLVAQGEQLKALLCKSPAQCPHTTVLRDRAGLASLLGPDASGDSLAEPILELVREIEARGLP